MCRHVYGGIYSIYSCVLMCASTYGGQTVMSDVFLGSFAFYFLRPSLPLKWRLLTQVVDMASEFQGSPFYGSSEMVLNTSTVVPGI